jgi:hypothetical protein
MSNDLTYGRAMGTHTMQPMARRDRRCSEPRHQAVNGSALMKIAILSAKDVADWHAATLMERGHQVTLRYLGHPPTAVAMLMKDRVMVSLS